jgi:hypothetical protein
MNGWNVAQINVARATAPLTDPSMADFVAALDSVNALAEAAPGFCWRLKGADGGSSGYVAFDEDDRVIVNMSVWSSIEALHAFVYGGAHVVMLRQRRRWFSRESVPVNALWWIQAGSVPTLDDGRQRLAILRAVGASPDAFTFETRFPPPA